jgi:integrase/recombinase XerD
LNKYLGTGGLFVHRKETDELVKSFASWLRIQGKSDGTLNTYIGVINCFCDFMFKNGLNMQDIQSEDVQAYIHNLEKENKSPGTVEKHFAAISVFSKFLNNPKIILNIERKLKEKVNEVPESLNPAEQKKLIEEVLADGNLRNITMIFTLLHTGIRVSELCDLNKDDVILDPDNAYLIVKQVNSNEGREIPLSDELRKYLERYIDSQSKDNPALFVSNINKRLTPRAVQYILKKYNVHPHKLRHTFCQKLINNGVDLHTVSKLAGHKDINVTKRYSKEIEPDVKRAIDKTFI